MTLLHDSNYSKSADAKWKGLFFFDFKLEISLLVFGTDIRTAIVYSVDDMGVFLHTVIRWTKISRFFIIEQDNTILNESTRNMR